MATDKSRIAVEELKELAGFWTDKGDALSMYLKAGTPSALSHREEQVFAKELVQQALGSIKGRNQADKTDIRRVLETVMEMKGNGGYAKIIFACAREKVWREYDVAGSFVPLAEAGPAFTLAPLLAQQQTRRRYCIAMADRNNARLLLLEAGLISEHSQVLDEEREKIRTTGTGKSPHYERAMEEHVRKHYQFLAEHLLHFHEHKDYDYLIVGCRDEMWPEIEAALHPELKRILVGRFPVDPGLASPEEVREKAQAIVDRKDSEDEERLVEKAVGGAAAHGLGAMGLKAVIDALEKGEVSTLLWPDGDLKEAHGASLCENCGHLEGDDLQTCTLCGARMRRFAHAEEALLRHALGRNIEVRMLRRTKLPPPHKVGAVLRFRVDATVEPALAS